MQAGDAQISAGASHSRARRQVVERIHHHRAPRPAAARRSCASARHTAARRAHRRRDRAPPPACAHLGAPMSCCVQGWVERLWASMRSRSITRSLPRPMRASVSARFAPSAPTPQIVTGRSATLARLAVDVLVDKEGHCRLSVVSCQWSVVRRHRSKIVVRQRG